MRAAVAFATFTLLACACSGAHTFTGGRPAVRVLAKAGCPKTIKSYRDVTNEKNALGSTLLLSSAPMGVLVCGYGSAFDGSKLTRSRALTVAQSRNLAAVVNRIHLGEDRGTHGCPPGKGLVTIFAFIYRADPDVDLWWNRDGCQSLDNGSRIGVEVGNPSFYNVFDGEMQRLRQRTHIC